jgi:hypothetical protein
MLFPEESPAFRDGFAQQVHLVSLADDKSCRCARPKPFRAHGDKRPIEPRDVVPKLRPGQLLGGEGEVLEHRSDFAVPAAPAP